MILRNVEVEVCVCGGCEGVITPTLQTEELTEPFGGEELRGVEYRVFQEVSQT